MKDIAGYPSGQGHNRSLLRFNIRFFYDSAKGLVVFIQKKCAKASGESPNGSSARSIRYAIPKLRSHVCCYPESDCPVDVRSGQRGAMIAAPYSSSAVRRPIRSITWQFLLDCFRRASNGVSLPSPLTLWAKFIAQDVEAAQQLAIGDLEKPRRSSVPSVLNSSKKPIRPLDESLCF
jgi:hypothetical protein